jgi:hypothetical protein
MRQVVEYLMEAEQMRSPQTYLQLTRLRLYLPCYFSAASCHMRQVVEYLMEAEGMHVVVEPSMYEEAAAAGLPMDRLFTFTPEESGRSGCALAHNQQQQQQQQQASHCVA